jgi:hypothetical protein
LYLVFLAFMWQKVRLGDIKKLSFSPISFTDRVGSVLREWLDTSAESPDSEVNKYYVPWIGWELSDTANWSEANCVVCQLWVKHCGGKVVYFTSISETWNCSYLWFVAPPVI